MREMFTMDNGADLIGTPFRYGARGPDAYDCYGLVMEMTRRNGQTLPDFGFADNQALIAAMMGATLPQWQETQPAGGAVALIRIGRHASHVGYLINADQMIHTWDKSGGVTLQRVDEWKQRIMGFYKHVGN